jgi:hypothetical protein
MTEYVEQLNYLFEVLERVELGSFCPQQLYDVSLHFTSSVPCLTAVVYRFVARIASALFCRVTD